MDFPIFTVFTPTYNRAHTLHRVYECLCLQTFKDFEWLIVDDGSTDDTVDLVFGWTKASRIAIRYIKQENQGKHVAFNLGVENAKGELFLPLDSDDSCTPQALERFYARWQAIPENLRSKFSGITCLCKDEQGDIIGGTLPNDVVDGRFHDVLSQLKRTGEMWGFHKTSVLREFPFPIFFNEKFVPEGLVWNRISGKYLMRFINEPLRHYFTSGDSLSSKMTRIRIDNPNGTIVYYKELLNIENSAIKRIKVCINIWRFYFQSKGIKFTNRLMGERPLIMLLTFMPGLIFAFMDVIFHKMRRK